MESWASLAELSPRPPPPRASEGGLFRTLWLTAVELSTVDGEVACGATYGPVTLSCTLLRKCQWAVTSCCRLCWGRHPGPASPRGPSGSAPTAPCSPQRVRSVFPSLRDARRCCCAAHFEALA